MITLLQKLTTTWCMYVLALECACVLIVLECSCGKFYYRLVRSRAPMCASEVAIIVTHTRILSTHRLPSFCQVSPTQQIGFFRTFSYRKARLGDRHYNVSVINSTNKNQHGQVRSGCVRGAQACAAIHTSSCPICEGEWQGLRCCWRQLPKIARCFVDDFHGVVVNR